MSKSLDVKGLQDEIAEHEVFNAAKLGFSDTGRRVTFYLADRQASGILRHLAFWENRVEVAIEPEIAPHAWLNMTVMPDVKVSASEVEC